MSSEAEKIRYKVKLCCELSFFLICLKLDFFGICRSTGKSEKRKIKMKIISISIRILKCQWTEILKSFLSARLRNELGFDKKLKKNWDHTRVTWLKIYIFKPFSLVLTEFDGKSKGEATKVWIKLQFEDFISTFPRVLLFWTVYSSFSKRYHLTL